MRRTGWLETSDPSLNQLLANTVWSMRGNFVGVPTDCPQRDERLGWTGDLNAFAPTAVFLYDVREVLGSWLADLRAEQAESGNVSTVVPDVFPGSVPTALWSDVAVSLPWLLYQEYGDQTSLRRSYDSMTTFVRQVEQALDEHDLWNNGFQYGDWLDPDAPADNPAGGKTDRYLIAQVYLCKTTDELARTAEALGEHSDALHYREVAERVRAAFRRECVTPGGRLMNESAAAYALALRFAGLEGEQRRTAGRRLAEVVRDNGHRISTGFAGTPHVTDALVESGYLQDAYSMLMQTEAPSFLYPVTQGATTVWERWDAVLPDGSLNSAGMTSLNHYALGAVADWMYRTVGGLQRLEPGWRRLRIAPQPGGGLTWAMAAHDSVAGRIECSWRIEDATMSVEVLVPEGASAEVVLPLNSSGLVQEVGPGAYHWTYPLPDGYEKSGRLTMDSPIGELMSDGPTWNAVFDVFARYFPYLPLKAGLAARQEATLSELLVTLAERLPVDVEALRADLQAAIAA